MRVNAGVAGVFSGFVGQQLIVTGGSNFAKGMPWEDGKKQWWKTLYCFDEATKKVSVIEDFLLRSIAYGASVQLPNGVLCIGGCDGDSCYKDVFFITIKDNKLICDTTSFPPLPVALAHMAIAVNGQKKFLAGGQERVNPEQATRHFLLLDLNDEKLVWKVLPSWKGEARGYAAAVAQNEKVYLFGGRNYGKDQPTKVLTDAHAFNIITQQWETIPGDFYVMAAHAIGLNETEIIFLGGVEKLLPAGESHPGFGNIVSRFNTVTLRLDTIQQAPFPLPVTTNIAQKGDEYFITSGELKPGIRTPYILRFKML